MTTVAPEPGDVIEDYEILEKMGGNMGLVFKARHRLLEKIVALKLLPADFITDPARLARFQRELRVMGQLEHPNLVTAADARVVGCWHLVAMELIEGMDLQRLVQTRGPLPVAAACEAARQTAVGLEYAHQHGLIHRDIKPSNLMLTRAGVIKVIDMGLALTRDESTAQLTHAGLVLGTMSYCAPEQFRDPARVDIRADIYSLGCTLYHLLTGKPPYSERMTFHELVQAHLNEPFPALAKARPDAPSGLDPVLARMTAKDPNARFATPDQVADALSPFVQGADRLLPSLAKTPEGGIRPVGRTDKWLEGPSRKPEKATAKAIIIPAAGAPVVIPRVRRSAVGAAQKRRTQWKRIAASVVVLGAIGSAIFLITNFSNDNPVVVLMDTTARDGVYDKENRESGGNNAQVLSTVLQELKPYVFQPEPVSAEWKRHNQIVKWRPRLVIMHRSMFFHALNAKFKFGSPRLPNDDYDPKRWGILYEVADQKLIDLVGFVGTMVPRTEFLIYSRGTDTNWLSLSWRDDWVKKLEVQYPDLRGRVRTMEIPGDYNTATFKNAEIGRRMRDEVRQILQLPDKRE